jgi:hypothetical protein
MNSSAVDQLNHTPLPIATKLAEGCNRFAKAGPRNFMTIARLRNVFLF